MTQEINDKIERLLNRDRYNTREGELISYYRRNEVQYENTGLLYVLSEAIKKKRFYSSFVITVIVYYYIFEVLVLGSTESDIISNLIIFLIVILAGIIVSWLPSNEEIEVYFDYTAQYKKRQDKYMRALVIFGVASIVASSIYWLSPSMKYVLDVFAILFMSSLGVSAGHGLSARYIGLEV